MKVFRSAPEQKAFPEPVSIATSTDWSTSKSTPDLPELSIEIVIKGV